jgi:hypothetical protein
MLENMGVASNMHLMLFADGTHSNGDPDIAHLAFTQKPKCGGGWWESHHKFHPYQISWYKRWCQLRLAKKKRERKKKKKEADEKNKIYRKMMIKKRKQKKTRER